MARFGQGTGPIFLDDLSCTGTELNILSCPRQSLGSNNCGHNEDAGVICEGTGMRSHIHHSFFESVAMLFKIN